MNPGVFANLNKWLFDKNTLDGRLSLFFTFSVHTLPARVTILLELWRHVMWMMITDENIGNKDYPKNLTCHDPRYLLSMADTLAQFHSGNFNFWIYKKKKKTLNIFLEITFAFSSQSPDNYVMKHTFLLLTKESLLSKSKMETTHTHVRNSPSLPLLPSGLKSRGWGWEDGWTGSGRISPPEVSIKTAVFRVKGKYEIKFFFKEKIKQITTPGRGQALI